MKYDFLQKVATEAYPHDNIEFTTSKQRAVKKKKERKLTALDKIIIPVGLCLAASLILLLVQIVTKVDSLSDVFSNIFGQVGAL